MRIGRALVTVFFFFNDTATTEIYTLSLHDALPISLEAAEDHPGPLDGAKDDPRSRETQVIRVEFEQASSERGRNGATRREKEQADRRAGHRVQLHQGRGAQSHQGRL